jgi:hypothetical protein
MLLRELSFDESGGLLALSLYLRHECLYPACAHPSNFLVDNLLLAGAEASLAPLPATPLDYL